MKTVVGSLMAGLPAYVSDPPIEAVCFAFGVNEDAQLGLDANGTILSPKVLEALLGTRLRGRSFARTPLVAGSRNSMAISADGDVYTWGWNSRATLGHGHRDPIIPKPRRVAGLRGITIVQVALGGWHALYLDNQGQVWASGGDEYMQSGQGAKERDVLAPTMCLPPTLRVCQVSAGGMHSLALTEDGQLWTWGEPWGSFSMNIDREPRRVEVENPEDIAERGGFVAIACGAFHNLALCANGEIYSWGLNDYGQLGLGHTASVTAPQRIMEGLEGVAAADISCGGWHSALVSTTGEVFMFGRGEYGRLGLGDKSGSSKLRPAKIWALEGVRMVQVSCGGSHTLGVDSDGKAWAWGRGSFGRLGTGEQKDAITPVEIKLPGGPDRWHCIAVAAGGRHSLCFALPDNGDFEERQSSSGWDRRRSPIGLSPQSSGININTSITHGSDVGSRRGVHVVSRHGHRHDHSENNVRVDEDLSSLIQETQDLLVLQNDGGSGEISGMTADDEQSENDSDSSRGDDRMDGNEDGGEEPEEKITLESLIASAPSRSSVPPTSSLIVAGTPVQSLVTVEALQRKRDRMVEGTTKYDATAPGAKENYGNEGEEEEEEEFGDVAGQGDGTRQADSDHNEDEEEDIQRRDELRRAATVAAVMVLGLRDDLLGDQP